jgi:predicted component of type VI protein secretion system
VREQAIDSAGTLVGRDPVCDLVISDIAVSKRHLKLETSDAGVFVEDMGSANGTWVNGLRVRRQRIQHLDVIAIGNHKMHVFDVAFLPEGGLDVETGVQAAGAPVALGETQPGTAPAPAVPAPPIYALKAVDQPASALAPLGEARTVVGAPGKAALIVRRREKLLLTKLSRSALNVNGREVEGASLALEVNDVIDVGGLRYQLVCLT